MNKRFLAAGLAAAVISSVLASCGGGAESGGPAVERISLEVQPNDSESMKAAKTKYQQLCTTCHGASGKGDGAASASLNPKPRDYSSASWQDAVTDEHIGKVIVGGGPAVGLSAIMPPSPDLADKPEVVKDLVKIVRSFRGR